MADPVNSAKVLFLNTDELPALETNFDDRIQNPEEAELIHIITEALCASGVSEESIGVITVYRAQLRLLNSKLKHRSGIEVLTADRSQGRDKDCVIISLVRANESNNIGDLLRDWRRLNVTFTRAKSKLIIIGSRRTLDSSIVLKAFLEVIDENGWAYKLPQFASQLYTVPTTHMTDDEFSQKRDVGLSQKMNARAGTTKRPAPVVSPLTSPTRHLKQPKQRVRARGDALLSSFGGAGVTQDVMVELGLNNRSHDGVRAKSARKTGTVSQNSQKK